MPCGRFIRKMPAAGAELAGQPRPACRAWNSLRTRTASPGDLAGIARRLAAWPRACLTRNTLPARPGFMGRISSATGARSSPAGNRIVCGMVLEFAAGAQYPRAGGGGGRRRRRIITIALERPGCGAGKRLDIQPGRPGTGPGKCRAPGRRRPGKFMQNDDLLAAWPDRSLDMLISNPPYVTTAR